MEPKVEITIRDILSDGLATILQPGVDAIQLQRDFHIRSVEDIPSGLERAGYEVSHVDLPTKVSGAALMIDGIPHIMINRAKTSLRRTFAIAHELGHLRLHLDGSRDPDSTTQLPPRARELEANMFATMFVAPLTCGEQQEQLLAQNPEIRSTVIAFALGTFLAILVVVVMWLRSLLFRAPDSAVIATT